MARTPSLLARLVAYLTRYVAFPSPDTATAVALWIAGTYLWTHLDTYPYLVITSDTKRSGKTRLAELVTFASANAHLTTGVSAAAVYRMIRDEAPVLLFDEAERMSKGAASLMREVTNSGYRKGQTVPRASGAKVEHWPTYCPKVFILIGDVNDTLRDRSMIARLRRVAPTEAAQPERFVFDVARGEGEAIGADLKVWADEHAADVVRAYTGHAPLTYLTDRDAEIWLALATLAESLDPAIAAELPRIAVDMATEKTATIRRYVDLAGAESDAEESEYGLRLLRDLSTVFAHDRAIFTRDALDRLYAIPTAPWRKFRGSGLSPMDLAALLSRYGVEPKYVRLGKHGAKNATGRGYRKEDVNAALKRNGMA